MTAAFDTTAVVQNSDALAKILQPFSVKYRRSFTRRLLSLVLPSATLYRPANSLIHKNPINESRFAHENPIVLRRSPTAFRVCFVSTQSAREKVTNKNPVLPVNRALIKGKIKSSKSSYLHAKVGEVCYNPTTNTVFSPRNPTKILFNFYTLFSVLVGDELIAFLLSFSPEIN